MTFKSLVLKNSAVSVHALSVMNCPLVIQDTATGAPIEVLGPGGIHDSSGKDKMDAVAFYAGRGAVIPQGGKCKPADLAKGRKM